MENLEIDKKLNEYAKKSKKIVYSTKLYEIGEKEKPKIILRDLKGKEDKKSIWAIILGYEIDDIHQEVILGTLEDTTERLDKARKIINLVDEQLKDNFYQKEGYKAYEKIAKYVINEKIPFKFTLEGLDILSDKTKEKIQIDRTYFENSDGNLQGIFTKEQLEKMKEEKSSGLLNYIKEQKRIQKWNERREKLLSVLDDKEKEAFLKGEKIVEYIKENKEKTENKEELCSNYLIEALEKNEDKSKIDLAKAYLEMKEKGFAINIKIVLEAQRDRCYQKIQDENNKEKENGQQERQININKLLSLIDRINEYMNLFELIKAGRDWNARFTYKNKKINFSEINELCKIYNKEDKDIIKYLELKENVMQTVDLKKIETNYKDSENIKKLYQFLLKTNVKDYTNPDMYSAKNVVISNSKHLYKGLYEHIIRELVEYNIESVKTFNKYAEKSEGVYTYPVTQKKEPIRDFSTIIKEMSEELTSKIEISKEDNKEKKQEEEEDQR